MEQLFCIPAQVAHHIAISDKFAAKECAIFLPWKPDGVQFFCLERLRGCNFFAKV